MLQIRICDKTSEQFSSTFNSSTIDLQPRSQDGFFDPDEGLDPLKKSLNFGSDCAVGTEMV